MRPPHLNLILKLLLLSGRGNPNVHERASAKEKADALMERHGVTLEQMRDLYRQEMGLPPKAGARPRMRRSGRRHQPMTTEEIFELLTETIMRNRQEREQATAEGEGMEARDRLARRLREAIEEVLASHQDLEEFLIHLMALGIELSLEKGSPLAMLNLRWPPYPESARLFGVYAWSDLARRGLRYDQDSPRHRKALDALASPG